MQSRKITLRVAWQFSSDKPDETIATLYYAGRTHNGKVGWLSGGLIGVDEIAIVSAVRRLAVVSEYKSDKIPMFVTGQIFTKTSPATHRGMFKFPLVTGMASTIPDPMNTLPELDTLQNWEESKATSLGGYVEEYYIKPSGTDASTDMPKDAVELKRNNSALADKRLLVLNDKTVLCFSIDNDGVIKGDEIPHSMGMVADVTFEVFAPSAPSAPSAQSRE